MKPKLGRPKIPKAKLRGILIQARLSPEEYKTIEAAITQDSESKSESEWVRKALLTTANRRAA